MMGDAAGDSLPEPSELAAELGITTSTFNEWLRRTYRRPPADYGKPWTLSPEMVAAARARWVGGRRAVTPRPKRD